MQMQINMAEIGQEITSKEAVLQAEWLSEFLDKFATYRFSIEKSQTVTVYVQRIGLDIILRSRFVLGLNTDCSSCTRSFDTEALVDFNITLRPMPREQGSQQEDQELSTQDLEEYYYEGDDIDLGEILREQILLGLPMYPRCVPNCKGLCTICGANLNLEPCDCEREDCDPRWVALKNISKH